MFSPKREYEAVGEAYAQRPPKGIPECIALPGTERPGRSRIYRHWQSGSGELLKTLDPQVRVRNFRCTYSSKPCRVKNARHDPLVAG